METLILALLPTKWILFPLGSKFQNFGQEDADDRDAKAIDPLARVAPWDGAVGRRQIHSSLYSTLITMFSDVVAGGC
jgi:hypothetical protein